MDKEEDDPDDETDASDNDVGDSQERVLATEKAGCGDDDALGPLELLHPKAVVNVEPVIEVLDRESVGEGGVEVVVIGLVLVVHAAVQLPEVWKSCCSHPDNQVLVQQPVVVWVLSVQLPEWLPPVPWLDKVRFLEYTLQRFACWNLGILELVSPVTFPRNLSS